MRKKLGQESLPAEEFHLCIISSLCLVKLLGCGTHFFMSGFQFGHYSGYTMWLSNFLAGEWLLSAPPLAGFPFGRATFELGLPRALISNAIDPKQQKWFHVERPLTVPGLTLTSKQHRIVPKSPISYIPTLHCFLRKKQWGSTLNITYITVLTTPQITNKQTKIIKVCCVLGIFLSFLVQVQHFREAIY